MKQEIDEAKQYIEGLPRFAGRSSIELMQRFFEVSHHPEKHMKIIHVAGTNGKGSVVKLLSGMLVQAGFRVGRFVSPHLIRTNERIALNETDISDEDFVRVYRKVRMLCEENAFPTLCFFEFFFLMAILYYAEQKTDYVVLETGLGGRLDATTSIPAHLNIITSIGMDHMYVLGDTIEKIAMEKAGILTNSSPVVFHTGHEEADRVVLNKIADMGIKRYINVQDCQITIHNFLDGYIDFSFINQYDRYEHLWLHSEAEYQVENASTCIAALQLLRPGNPELEESGEIIRDSLRNFHWEARMERVRDWLFVDGAHNEDAMKRFLASARTICHRYSPKKVHVLFAAASDKDYQEVIRLLLSGMQINALWLTEIQSGRRLAVEQLEQTVEEMDESIRPAEVHVSKSAAQALREIEESRGKNELVYVVGSLYLAAEVKDYYQG